MSRIQAAANDPDVPYPPPPFCLKPGLSLAENGARLHGLSLGATRLRDSACAESAKLNAAARDAPKPRPPLRQRAAGWREAGRGGAGSAASFSLALRRPPGPSGHALAAARSASLWPLGGRERVGPGAGAPRLRIRDTEPGAGGGGRLRSKRLKVGKG